MVRAIITGILVLIAAAGLVGWLSGRRRAKKAANEYDLRDARTVATVLGWGTVAAFASGVIVLATGLFTVVPANHAGVEVLFGKPTRAFQEGFNVKNPLASVSEIPGLQQESTYSNTVGEGERGGPDAVEAITADNAVVDVDASVLWALDLTGDAPIEAYRQYRTLERIRLDLLRPVSRDVIRDCIAAVAFEEARTSQREAIGECARVGITSRVDEFGVGVTIRAVQIRSMSARSAELQAGIDRKLVAEQAAREAEFRKDQAEIDAETARIAAEGVANAEIERARGIAEANRLVDQSLTPSLLRYRQYEFLTAAGNTVWVLEGDNDPELVIPMGAMESG